VRATVAEDEIDLVNAMYVDERERLAAYMRTCALATLVVEMNLETKVGERIPDEVSATPSLFEWKT
jgi:hypothetical protein